MNENQQTVEQLNQKHQGRLMRGAKNAADYVTDGSQGSIIDAIKITIRIIAEFVKAVKEATSNE